MSVALMTKIWETCVYSGACHSVLLVLADHGHDNGRNAYPGVDLIAAKTRLSIRAVKYALRQLEEDRVIVPQDDASGGRGKTTRYFIDLQRVQELHCLHQAENPACEWCAARARAELRNGAFRDRKGATGAKKGAIGDRHIDRTVKEPSRTSLASAGADGSETRLELPDRFPDFRHAVGETWPGGFPPEDEVAAGKRWLAVIREFAPDLVIACARLHGAAKAAARPKRGERAGGELLKRPSNWLKSGDWRGYIPQAEAAVAQEARITTALGSVRRALGGELFDLLRRKGVSDASIAMLEGAAMQPPATVTITRPVQRTLLERHFFDLERLLGARPNIVLVRGVS